MSTDFQLSNSDSSSADGRSELALQRATQVLAAYSEADPVLRLADKTSANAFFGETSELAPFVSEAKTRQVCMRDLVLAVVALALGLCFIFVKSWRAISAAGVAKNESFVIHPISDLPIQYRQFQGSINESISSGDFKRLRDELTKALEQKNTDPKGFPTAILGCAFELLAQRKADSSWLEADDSPLAGKARNKFQELHPQLALPAMVARLYFECFQAVTPIVDWQSGGGGIRQENISTDALHALRQSCLDLRPASMDEASRRRLEWVYATTTLVELWIPKGASGNGWQPQLSFDQDDTDLQKKWSDIHHVLWEKFTPNDSDPEEWRSTRRGFWATLNSYCGAMWLETIKIGSRGYYEKEIDIAVDGKNPQHSPP